MGIADSPIVQRLSRLAEERIGVGVRSSTDLRRSAIMEQEYATLSDHAETLAVASLNYLGGRPHELSTLRRREIAQRSRIALKFDPLAGTEADLLANFSFAKGVPMPTAKNDQVQAVIKEAWEDPNNQEKLLSAMALRALSNEMLTTGELYPTAFVANGHVTLGRLNADDIDNVVPDEDDRLRPLWYLTHKVKTTWDFKNDQPLAVPNLKNGVAVPQYWAHWCNVAIAKKQREDDPDADPLEEPPDDKLERGLVFPVLWNRTGEELRGNPPWARTLRYMTAMSDLTEAHVQMAKGAATIISKRVQSAAPGAIQRAATAVMGAQSELGIRVAGKGEGGQTAFAPGAPPPPPPGSMWMENQADRLESVKLSSGAGEMAQTAQIVRAPIAAAAGFGQHYFGDASNSNLATASTLDLPANMGVEAWQSMFEAIIRWFIDLVIREAARGGRLGQAKGDFDVPLSELTLFEAEAKIVKRTDADDLGYEFSMPFPGRRQLDEVGTFTQTLCTTFDPDGMNIPLRRRALQFAASAMGMDRVGEWVVECIPDDGKYGIGPNPAPGFAAGAGALPPGQGAPNDATGDLARNAPNPDAAAGDQEVQASEFIPAELDASLADIDQQIANLLNPMSAAVASVA